MLPFSRDAFFDVFTRYNEAVWPAPIVAYVLFALVLLLILRPTRWSGRIIATTLALMWAWTGLAYHIGFFAPINGAAYAFGAAFIIQGVLLLHAGWKDRLSFAVAPGPVAGFGWFLVLYAAVLYPLVGSWTGHAYPAAPSFGITPCPVTLLTIGLLLLTTRPVPKMLLIVPGLWSLIGGSAAFLLEVPQDWMLLVGGVLGTALLLVRDRGAGTTAPARRA